MKKIVLLATMITMAIPAVARAQDAPAAAPAAASAATETDPSKRAEMLANSAMEAYARNDFAKAVSLYLESYQAMPTAAVLYNIARIYDNKLNEQRVALEYYRRSSLSPDATPDLVAKSTTRLSAIQSTLQDGTSPQPKPSGSQEAKPTGGEEKERRTSLRVPGLIVAGAGGVGLVLGTVFTFVAKGKHSDANCNGAVCPSDSAVSTEKSAASMANVATVSFIAGGVLLAGGLTMFLLSPSKKESSSGAAAPPLRVAFAPLLGPTTAGIGITGTIR